MEHFAIECYINSKIEILPVPEIPQVIFRQSLPLDELALWYPTVVHHWFNHGNGVILKVVVDAHFSHAEVLIG